MGDLALRFTEFVRDTDVYGWLDAYGFEDDGFNKAVSDNYDLLMQFDDSIIDYLNSFMDDEDYHDRAFDLMTDILKAWY